jgi:hypothetical protein
VWSAVQAAASQRRVSPRPGKRLPLPLQPRTLHSTFAPSPCFVSTAHAAASRALRSDGALEASADSCVGNTGQPETEGPSVVVAKAKNTPHKQAVASPHGEAHNATARRRDRRRRVAGRRGVGLPKCATQTGTGAVTHLGGSRSSRLWLGRAGVGHEALHVVRDPPSGPPGAVPGRQAGLTATLRHQLLRRHEGHGSRVCVRVATMQCCLHKGWTDVRSGGGGSQHSAANVACSPPPPRR